MSLTATFRCDAFVPHPTIDGEIVVNGALSYEGDEALIPGRTYSVTFDEAPTPESGPLIETVENDSPPLTPEPDPTAAE